MNGFVGDSLQEQGTKQSTGNSSSVFPNGWYDMWSYENPGSGYFLNNSKFMTGLDDFGKLGETQTHNLVNGKWIVSHVGDTWVNNLASAGGKQMVGAAM